MSTPTPGQTFNFTATVPPITPPTAPGTGDAVYHLVATFVEVRDTSYIFTDDTGNVIGVFPLGTIITRDDALVTA